MSSVAEIKEDDCIGCTKCIQACPVDAIIGSSQKMHTVLRHECIGCGLCIEPCPVDCITMVSIEHMVYDKSVARQRSLARKNRLLKETQEKYTEDLYLNDKDEKLNYILKAMERTKRKRQ